MTQYNGSYFLEPDRWFAGPLRERAYPILRRRWARWISGALMRTPLRLAFANDLFAIAWRPGQGAPAGVWPHGWLGRLAHRLAHGRYALQR